MKNFDEIAKRLAILSDPCFRPLLGKRLSLLLKADHRCAQFDRSGDLERASAVLRRADVTDIDSELQRLSAAVLNNPV
jgi:hypothetical protein